jgi:hypothetical protein
MATKTNRPTGAVSTLYICDTDERPWRNPPGTMAERVQRIEALGQRINGHIQFICRAPGLHGTSAEAKDRAVAAFYERLALLERQLGQIHDELKCG